MGWRFCMTPSSCLLLYRMITVDHQTFPKTIMVHHPNWCTDILPHPKEIHPPKSSKSTEFPVDFSGFQALWGIPSRLSLGRRPLRRRRARAAEPGRRPEAAERRRCHGGDVGISAEARLPGPVTSKSSKSSKDVDGDMIVTDSEFSRNLNSLYMFVCKCYNMLYSYYYYILLYYLCMLYVLSIKQMVSSCSWSGKRTKLWQGSSMRTCNQDLRGAKSSGWVLNTCDWNPQMDAPWIYISDLLW